MRPIRAILQPANFSALAERAFELACQLARMLKARIVVILVATPAIQPWGRWSLVLGQPRNEWRKSEEKLHSIEAGDLEIERLFVPGEPAAAIVRTALEIDADLIVMRSPRRSSWRWSTAPAWPRR
jgi:nucleotide-binding universal stress UspA family protein